MLSKDKVLKQISALPNKFSIDELVEGLVVLEKIEKGLQEVQMKKVLNHSEIRKKITRDFMGGNPSE